MTRATRFDNRRELIYVRGSIAGLWKQLELRLVLDTGASKTLVTPDIIEKLGYSMRDAERRTRLSSALGHEHGYMLRVRRFATLGFAVSDFPVNVFALAEKDLIDGLIGWDCLRHVNLEVRPAEGRILVSTIAPPE